VPPPASITIVKDTDPETEGMTFFFQGDLGQFTLQDDQSATFDALQAGSYTITEEETPDWALTRIVCSETADINLEARTATIHLQPGVHVGCWFNNDLVPTPTPTPTLAPTTTPTPSS
jgi:hypothetical protein